MSLNFIYKKMAAVLYAVMCVISITEIAASGAQGYYWREFNGEIPEDALPGGTDADKNPIYIGQVLYQTYIVPAKIYADGRAYFEYGGKEHSSSPSMKILCTQYPEQFVWIPTNNNGIKLIIEPLVIGGYDKPRTTTYIGKVRAGGEVAVGKVLDDIEPENAGLHITRNGLGERHTSFEVLAFSDQPQTNVRHVREILLVNASAVTV